MNCEKRILKSLNSICTELEVPLAKRVCITSTNVKQTINKKNVRARRFEEAILVLSKAKSNVD